MPIGWNGLSMPTNACSVCMSIGRVISRSGVLIRTLSHIWWRLYLPIFILSVGLLTLTWIDSFIFLARPWSSLPMMLKFSGVVLCPVWVAVHMDGRGFLQVFLVPYPQGPRCSPYVFFNAYEFLALVHVDISTFLIYRILVFGFD